MKVQDLLAEESLKDYLRRLVSKEGIKLLGGGAFSQVFQHPTLKNVVTKVYTSRDTAYADYLAWCKDHQDNPYAPKIIDDVPYRNGQDAYHIVFMEKLKPIPNEYGYIRKFIQIMKLNPDEDEELLDILDEAIKHQDMEVLKSFMRTCFKEGRGDAKLAEIWKKIISYGVGAIDLHHGNVMLRGAQLVFTDPVAAKRPLKYVYVREELLTEGEATPANVDDSFEVEGVKFDNHNGLGATPNSANIMYRGAVAWIRPSIFRKLALKADRSGDAKALEEKIRAGAAIAVPWLDLEIVGEDFSQPEDVKVAGHEGRARAEAFMAINGDIPMPVQLQLGPLRARHLHRGFFEWINDFGLAAERSSNRVMLNCKRFFWEGREIKP